ncbi:type II toxin-antitoxin system HicB family antitoxin [Longimicrobium sp.]|uniref:type II toxin-antitoxin system HicB family antitoxin n=1 Tax=Longimicrobium sp. TaxID=2029185 RepID=UPI002C34E9D8|nr:type II toxin-antitoxin system HicB family antitoxin [Longimicrobium sp.]HSU15133.1 type II toxin-antitoxin system HicB family antitoxin [Longimicrobium sp.]
MNYRGYTARYDIDEDDRVLVGRIDGIRDVVTFEGDTFNQLEEEFHRSVDEYIRYCREQGAEPERPYSGTFLIRTTPARHAAVAKRAREENTSLNSWVIAALDRALERTPDEEVVSAFEKR